MFIQSIIENYEKYNKKYLQEKAILGRKRQNQYTLDNQGNKYNIDNFIFSNNTKNPE